MAARRQVWTGRPYPLGPSFDGYGTNFAVFSSVAERVELCLFEGDREERIDLAPAEGHVWTAFLPGVGVGTQYGFRVHGPWDPKAGLRCNPHKLLLDPYARSFAGSLDWHSSLFGHQQDAPEQRNDEDSAPHQLRGVVVDPFFDWGADRPLQIPWHDTVIYEAHVKGFTMRHPGVPEELRGTYLGLAHPNAIAHLKSLGVTAIELLPVHQFVHDGYVLDKGLRNYWGYNTIGYFAPHDEYTSRQHCGAAIAEFKYMVRSLHQAGIEVILDVVYNHTAEGNHLGPTLSFKGLDNQAYYRLVDDDPFYYFDTTGTGNSMHMRQPHVLQLMMDSLRYWVQEMRVDGFRFDLAATLARELHDVDRLATFLQLVHQDPILRRVKLIAEPWDLGSNGYQVGGFPPLWSEWNGKYRDNLRDFWRGQPGALGELGARFTGSADLYQDSSRRPYASINFITAHDGFTLRDLVSYNEKHNDANGEESRDGTDDNRSWNCGAEGETSDPAVLELRARQQRNLLATLFLSQGTPMMLAGDELGRTQQGNNNAYCQDNEISWIDWEHADRDLLAFTRQLIHFYRAHPSFRRRGWFSGDRDIVWLTPDGATMKAEHWQSERNALAVFLDGTCLTARDAWGQRVVDDSFFVAINAFHEPVTFTIPPKIGGSWHLVFDTAKGFDSDAPVEGRLEVVARSLTVLRRRAG
jgi:isoamylase